MEKYIKPAICEYEIGTENVILSGSAPTIGDGNADSDSKVLSKGIFDDWDEEE